MVFQDSFHPNEVYYVVETNHSLKEIQEIDGVYQVHEERIGHVKILKNKRSGFVKGEGNSIKRYVSLLVCFKGNSCSLLEENLVRAEILKGTKERFCLR